MVWGAQAPCIFRGVHVDSLSNRSCAGSRSVFSVT